MKKALVWIFVLPVTVFVYGVAETMRLTGEKVTEKAESFFDSIWDWANK